MTSKVEATKLSRRALLAGGGALAVGAAAVTRGRWLGLLGGRGLDVARFAAMGTYLEVTSQGAGPAVVQAAVGVVGALERGLSAFLSESELGRLNARGARERVAVSSELRAVLEESRRIHAATAGAFDPTVAPLMAAWGFRGGRPTTQPGRDQLREMLSRTGLGHVDVTGSGVSFDAEGLGLDLGGIAKGYAADRAAAELSKRGLSGLVNAGGDLRAAGAQPDGAPWGIGVRHPVRPAELLARVELPAGQAIATSGTYEQRFEVGGRVVTHLLDPRSGEPVDGVVSATVRAPTAMQADALATAACVLGCDEAMKALSALPGVEALLVARRGAGYRVEATRGLRVEMLASV